MVNWNRNNKNELFALTGAVYTFVAYLTAFTLEILFIIDLAKQNGGFLTLSTSSPYSASTTLEGPFTPPTGGPPRLTAFEQARVALESMQAHITISCLAISILYFVLFVASLILIIGLILRSAFLVLIWMCIMTTMYLPEFGLIVYITVYGWGLGTRNGQTELVFYLFRAALNIIFIFRAHRLFKDWSYEKNFFMLKSSGRLSGYDSPYFINDSLSTTINPIFSTSSLHLNSSSQHPELNSTSSTSTGSANSRALKNAFDHYDIFNYNRMHGRAARDFGSPNKSRQARHSTLGMLDDHLSTPTSRNFYLGKSPNHQHHHKTPPATTRHTSFQHDRSGSLSRSSALSFNDQDEYADLEMDLDYRTLTNSQRYHHATLNQEPAPAPCSRVELNSRNQNEPTYQLANYHNSRSPSTTTTGTGLGLSYSTQSLDRRNLKNLDYSLPEHVILRPLGHQPFEYLQRPGSTSNLNSSTNLNTHSYTSTTKLARKFGGLGGGGSSSKEQSKFL